jgi:hypothetical protein
MRLFGFLFLLTATVLAAAAPLRAEPAFGPHVIYGVIRRVAPAEIVVQRHQGQLESVDIKQARSLGRTGVLYRGRPVALYGDFDRARRYHVNAITSAYGIERGIWPADR